LAVPNGIMREKLLLWSGVAFAALSLSLLVLHVAAHVTAAGFAGPPRPQLGDDFINYWSGARFAALGQAKLAYDRDLFFHFEQSIVGSSANFKIYGYPPVAMLMTLPLAAFSFLTALALWVAAGTALCSSLLSRLVGWPMALLATMGAPAAFLNLISGQNGYFTAAALAGGLMLLDRRPIIAGAVLGLLCFKPHMALLLPVALMVDGRWKSFLAAAASAAFFTAVSVVFFGIDAWSGFLESMAYQRQMMEMPHDDWFHRMPTVFAALRLAGSGVTSAYAAQMLSTALAIAAVALVWKSRCTTEIKAAALVVAVFLATPYAWDYDMIVLLFSAAWLARDARRSGYLPGEKIMIIALLVLPLAMILTGTMLGLQIGPLMLWLLLLLLLRRARVFQKLPDPVLHAGT
jgi:glycosyl transferase family 87